MLYNYGLVELNKYIVQNGSWFPGQLYIGLADNLSGVVFSPNGKVSMDETFFAGYSRLPMSTGNWKLSYSAYNVARMQYDQNIEFSFSNYPSLQLATNYFIIDTPTGTGTVINYGQLIYGGSFQAINLIISGVYIQINGSTDGTFSSALLTPTGIRMVAEHLVGIKEFGTGFTFKPTDATLNEYGVQFSFTGLEVATTGNQYIHNTSYNDVGVSNSGYIYNINVYTNDNYIMRINSPVGNGLMGKLDCGGTWLPSDIPVGTHSNVFFPFLSFDVIYD